MKAVIQRGLRAQVDVDGKTVGKIERGILTLLGVGTLDTTDNAQKLMKKIAELRIFEDDAGKLNLSLQDIQGQHLVVSQFTLLADTSSGRRPSFIAAARPEQAKPLYEAALAASRALGVPTEGGVFQADMKVSLVNDGPVTLILEV